MPELCQAVTDSILLQIEPLSQDRAIIDLLAVSVERNVTTLVHIIGYQWCFQELAAQASDLPTAFAAAMRLTESTFEYIDRVFRACLHRVRAGT